MDVQYLDCDELGVECIVRNITGNIVTKMARFQEVYGKEVANEIEPPKRAHPAAIKCPKREITTCSSKLKNIENQLQNFSAESDFRPEKIAELMTGVLHVGHRLTRISSSSKSVAAISTKLITLCEKLLSCLKDIRSEKMVSEEMGNSLKQVFSDLEANQESGTNESSDDAADPTETNNEQNRQVKSQPNNSEPQIVKNPIPNNLTEDERVDLIVDRLYRKLSLTGIPPPSGRPKPIPANISQPQNKRTPISNSIPLPENFNPLFPPPSHGMTSNHPINNLVPTNSSSKIPKQYLEIHHWKMCYHGDEKDELPVERFLYRVQRMASENGLHKDRLAANFSVLLKDRALNWYWEYHETNGLINWEILSEAMIQRFKTRRSDDDVKQALERRKQRFKEPFLDFYHSIRSMTLSLMRPLPEIDLMNLLSRNMRGGLQAKFAGQQFNNIADMVEQCVTVEDTWSRIGWTPEIYHQTRPRHVSELEVIGNKEYDGSFGRSYAELPQYFDSVCAVSTSNNFRSSNANHRPKAIFEKALSPNACWNCFAIGHFFKECSIPINHRFCFGCGAPNVLKSQCVRCKNDKKGNLVRDFSNTGLPNSRIATNLPPRPIQEEAASNTDPELYQAILKRENNTKHNA